MKFFEEGFGIHLASSGSISFHVDQEFAQASEQKILEEHQNFLNWNLEKKATYLIVACLLDPEKFPIRQKLFSRLLLKAVPASDWAQLLLSIGPFSSGLAKRLQELRDANSRQSSA